MHYLVFFAIQGEGFNFKPSDSEVVFIVLGQLDVEVEMIDQVIVTFVDANGYPLMPIKVNLIRLLFVFF